MAYSQQSRYGGSQRPQYGSQEPSYNSVQSRGQAGFAETQPYGHGNGYGGDIGQKISDHYGSTEDPSHDQRDRSAAPMQYQRNDGYYTGRGQQHHRSDRPDHQRRPDPADRAHFDYNDTQGPSGPAYDAGSAENGQGRRQARQDHSREHRRPPDPRQPYERYQNVVPPRADVGNGYNEPFDESHDEWQAQQGHHAGFGQSAPAPDTHYQGRQQAQAQYSNGSDHGTSHDTHRNVAHSKYSQQATSVPDVPHPVPRDQESRQAKQPPKRILDDIKSPDTVAWDNPFPTFPAVKAKSKANGEMDEHSQNEGKPTAPYVASNSGRHNVTPHDGPKEHGSKQDGGQYGHSQSMPQSQNVHDPMVHAQERPNPSFTTRSAHRKQNSNTSELYGRHSEDNRTRPTISTDASRVPAYERSHTLPTAATDAISNPHDEMPEVAASWQEPGATAGYYGGEDKGFVSGSPIGNLRQEPVAAPIVHSDESRRHQPTSRFPPYTTQQSALATQTHAQQDSVGEVFDSYYNESSLQTKPYVKEDPYQRRRASFDEMPNFDGAQVAKSSLDRSRMIDQDLQPQPPVPTQTFSTRDAYNNQGQYPTSPYGVDPVPRSKSQPDFNGQRSSPHNLHQGQAFDFGVPDSRQPRPATSASNGRSGPRGYYPSAPLTDSHTDNAYTEGQQYSGGTPEAQQWSRDRSRGNGYQHNGQPPDSHRPPPTQHGYGDPRYQNGYGPSPPSNGPHPARRQPDRSRPPPQRIEPGQHSNQHDRYRSPPVQQGRPQDDRSRRPVGGSGGPSPSNRNGPFPPPNKPLPNPDALPHHPAPVRPGLMGGSPVNSANKPPPVRQYNSTSSPMNLAGPTEAPDPGRPQEGKRGASAVTYKELDRLRQKTQASPEDQATRFILAKKLVEASTVLVNERTDQRTRDKAREDYVAQALKMLKKLSGNQYPDAMFYLGDCYSRGALGLQSDVKEAFTLYQSAAKANHAQAAYRVAVCCEMGQDEGGGTRKDPIKAMQWYKRAAQLGDVPAMYKMGVIQLKGLLGQPRSPSEALVSLKRAAERADAENPHALHELGLLHEKGSDGIPKDEAYSKDLFVKCANLGYKFSQFRLGCAYEYGLMGCPVDPRQSIAWYSKAAVQEEHQSELALSGWYLTGSEGVLQQSDTEAYLWARKAAQAGMAKAEYAMGYFTEVGIGAPANLEDAKRWYWRAACESSFLISARKTANRCTAQNFAKARERLEDLRKGGAAKQKTRVSRSHMKKQSDGECIVM